MLKKQQKPKHKMTQLNNNEQSFISHLEALRKTLIHSIASVALLSPIGFFLAPRCLGFLIQKTLPQSIEKLHYFSPMEVFIIQLKAGVIIALILAFPYIAYQFKNFLEPALYENEKRLLRLSAAFSVILFILGGVFCLFVILPMVMNFSASFSTPQLEATISMENYINLVAALILGFGIMFQLPLLVLILVKLGLMSTKSLSQARPYIIVGILTVAAILTPPDILSQLMLGIPTWLLFEGGLIVARLIESNRDSNS